jgi:hypothetical protein
MKRYADRTSVPTDRSRTALEHLLRQAGASGFIYGWSEAEDRVEFVYHATRIRFSLPKLKAEQFERSPRGRWRTPQAAAFHASQAERQRWRALYLVVRAKLEAVEAGIGIFEQEFLGYVVTPSGQTIGELLVPRIQAGERLMLTQ